MLFEFVGAFDCLIPEFDRFGEATGPGPMVGLRGPGTDTAARFAYGHSAAGIAAYVKAPHRMRFFSARAWVEVFVCEVAVRVGHERREYVVSG